jgi:hypothetical protein
MAGVGRRVREVIQLKRSPGTAGAPEGGGQHLMQADVLEKLQVFEERERAGEDPEMFREGQRDNGRFRKEEKSSWASKEVFGFEESKGVVVRRLA